MAAYFTNCTIYGNSVTRLFGGGVSNYGGTATLTDCTISGNSAPTGGGVFTQLATDTTLTNTIVASNNATTGPDVDGGIVSDGHNLIGETDGSSGWVGSDLTGTVADPLDPRLAPLGDYGGPTNTIALLPGSPAIGAGTAVGSTTTDQRGFALDSPSPDIGAFQTNPLVVNTTTDGTASPFGDLSLRQAVNLANVLDAAESITFNATAFATAQTITLDGNQLELSDSGGPVTVTGPSAGVTISGGGLSRVFWMMESR